MRELLLGESGAFQLSSIVLALSMEPVGGGCCLGTKNRGLELRQTTMIEVLLGASVWGVALSEPNNLIKQICRGQKPEALRGPFPPSKPWIH